MNVYGYWGVLSSICSYGNLGVTLISFHRDNLSTQRPLRTRHLPLATLNPRRSSPQRHCQCLKRALGPVVVIEPPQAVHVNRDPRRLRKTLHAMRDHLAAQVSDLLALETQVNDGVGPVGEVYDGTRQRLVKGAVGRAEAGEANGCAEGVFEGGAEGDTDILCGVVIIDYEVVLTFYGELGHVWKWLTMKVSLTPKCHTPSRMLC